MATTEHESIIPHRDGNAIRLLRKEVGKEVRGFRSRADAVLEGGEGFLAWWRRHIAPRVGDRQLEAEADWRIRVRLHDIEGLVIGAEVQRYIERHGFEVALNQMLRERIGQWEARGAQLAEEGRPFCSLGQGEAA